MEETPIEEFLKEIGKYIDTYNIPDEVIDKSIEREREKLELAFYEGMQSFPFDANKGRAKLYYESTYKKD
jgi:hypothetical protein